MQNIIASQSQHKIKEEDRLLEFIKTHKENIFKMHKLLQENNCGFRTIFMHDNADMLIRLAKHDNSKYSKEEFDGYRIKLYPTEEEQLSAFDKDSFDKAIKHHYAHNTHHPQHYIDSDGSIRDMPVEDVYEMILDWMAISYYKHNITTKELAIYYAIYHYKTNRFPFSDNTRKLVDHYVEILMHLMDLMDCHFGLSS